MSVDLPVVNRLNQILSTTADFYYTYKHFHWNLQDSKFPVFHELFDKHASLILASQDIIAERLRQKGQRVELEIYSDAKKLSVIEKKKIETKNNLDKILQFLIKQHQLTIELLEKTIEESQEDPSTADYLTKFLQEHQLMQWFLTSSLS